MREKIITFGIFSNVQFFPQFVESYAIRKKKNTSNVFRLCIYLLNSLLGLVIGGISLVALENRNINNSIKAVESLRLITAAAVCLELIDGRRFVSWVILASTPLCICAYPAEPKTRLYGVALALLPNFALLSASYEPLFLIALTGHLLCWPLPTDENLKRSPRKDTPAMSIEDFVKAGAFVSFELI